MERPGEGLLEVGRERGTVAGGVVLAIDIRVHDNHRPQRSGDYDERGTRTDHSKPLRAP